VCWGFFFALAFCLFFSLPMRYLLDKIYSHSTASFRIIIPPPSLIMT
jgi:hypothetical protein